MSVQDLARCEPSGTTAHDTSNELQARGLRGYGPELIKLYNLASDASRHDVALAIHRDPDRLNFIEMSRRAKHRWRNGIDDLQMQSMRRSLIRELGPEGYAVSRQEPSALEQAAQGSASGKEQLKRLREAMLRTADAASTSDHPTDPLNDLATQSRLNAHGIAGASSLSTPGKLNRPASPDWAAHAGPSMQATGLKLATDEAQLHSETPPLDQTPKKKAKLRLFGVDLER